MSLHSDPHEALLDRSIDSFWKNLLPAWHRIRGNLRALVTERFDISIEQYHVLRHIHQGIVSISDLAAERSISRSAVSQTVDTLVGKGLVVRRENPDDRRFLQLALTEEGDRLLQSIFQLNRAWMRAQMSSLAPEELESIIQGIAALKKAFDSPVDRSLSS